MSCVIVFHSSYGCDTGCCGHVVQLDDEERFLFEHPYTRSAEEFVREVVTREFGEEHVADVDWSEVMVTDD